MFSEWIDTIRFHGFIYIPQYEMDIWLLNLMISLYNIDTGIFNMVLSIKMITFGTYFIDIAHLMGLSYNIISSVITNNANLDGIDKRYLESHYHFFLDE